MNDADVRNCIHDLYLVVSSLTEVVQALAERSGIMDEYVTDIRSANERLEDLSGRLLEE